MLLSQRNKLALALAEKWVAGTRPAMTVGAMVALEINFPHLAYDVGPPAEPDIHLV